MAFDDTWRSIRERLATLDPDDVLVTPDEERVFVVEEAGDGWIDVRFRDGQERVLPREQFSRLADEVDDSGLEVDDLPPGVAPYVAVLSLAPGYVVDRGTLRPAREEELAELAGQGAAGGADHETGDDRDGAGDREAAGGREASAEREAADDRDAPFVRSQWDVRRPPARLHDDALLLADALERHDAADLDGLGADELVDLYVLLSDVQRGANDIRRGAGDELLDYIGPDGREHGQFGSVSRVRRQRRHAKDDETVLEALDDAGVPRDWVLGVDEDRLDVVVATTDVDEDDVYDRSETYYVQKTSVDADVKRSRLQGLKDRLADADDERAADLREEIEELEDRIDDVLTTA